MPLLATDIDDTKGVFREELERWHRGKYGTAFFSPDLIDYPTTAHHERVLEFYRSGGLLDLPVIPGCREAIRHLADAGWGLISITHRSIVAQADTDEWLARNFDGQYPPAVFIYDELFEGPLDPQVRDKATACRKAGVEVIIEDEWRPANLCARAGIRTLLFSQPWNEPRRFFEYLGDLPSNMTRVHSWEEVVEVLEREYGIPD